MLAREKDAFWFGFEYELFWMLEFSLGLHVALESEKYCGLLYREILLAQIFQVPRDCWGCREMAYNSFKSIVSHSSFFRFGQGFGLRNPSFSFITETQFRVREDNGCS